MLKRLGILKAAYDWRQRHVPTFEEEILAYERYGLEFFAFWGWHDDFAALMEKHGIRPQIWTTVSSPPDSLEQKERIEIAAKGMLPLVRKTKALGCQLGIYNHGGWEGEPENMVAICRWLRDNAHAEHVGIVYNLHHGHSHIDNFSESLRLLIPYLLCLNLNGMNADAKPKILPIGQGEYDLELIGAIAGSGYDGPIGILCHDADVDAEVRLRENYEGLQKIVKQLEELLH
jgi:sugar phosphate isomerase/epimerase